MPKGCPACVQPPPARAASPGHWGPLGICGLGAPSQSPSTPAWPWGRDPGMHMPAALGLLSTPWVGELLDLELGREEEMETEPEGNTRKEKEVEREQKGNGP